MTATVETRTIRFSEMTLEWAWNPNHEAVAEFLNGQLSHTLQEMVGIIPDFFSEAVEMISNVKCSSNEALVTAVCGEMANQYGMPRLWRTKGFGVADRDSDEPMRFVNKKGEQVSQSWGAYKTYDIVYEEEVIPDPWILHLQPRHGVYDRPPNVECIIYDYAMTVVQAQAYDSTGRNPHLARFD